MRLRDVLRAGTEDVEDERAAGLEYPPDRAEHRATILVGLHVEERAERDRHERHRLLDRRIPEVAVAEVELEVASDGNPGERRLLARHLEHPLGEIDADHADPLGRDRDRDPARAHAELDHRTARAPRPLDVERDVLGHARETTGRRGGRSCRREQPGTCRYAAWDDGNARAPRVYLAPAGSRGSGPRRLTSRSLTGAPPTAARTKLENE